MSHFTLEDDEPYTFLDYMDEYNDQEYEQQPELEREEHESSINQLNDIIYYK